MSDRDEVIRLLGSIDASLRQIAKHFQPAAEVADDRELDSQYGDPVVKFNPRDWTGHNMKGRRMSECSPEFLDQLAGVFDYFAGQAEASGETTNSGKLVAPYKRKDAARARGWAKRLRSGWKPARAASSFGDVDTSTGELQDQPFEETSEWINEDPAAELTELTDADIPF